MPREKAEVRNRRVVSSAMRPILKLIRDQRVKFLMLGALNPNRANRLYRAMLIELKDKIDTLLLWSEDDYT